MGYRLKLTENAINTPEDYGVLYAPAPEGQTFADRLTAVVTIPMKDALASPDLLVDCTRPLHPGAEISLYRFADMSRDRLAETARIVIVEVFPHHVEWVLSGKVVAMPAPAEEADSFVIETISPEYRIDETEPVRRAGGTIVSAWCQVMRRETGNRRQFKHLGTPHPTREDAEKAIAWDAGAAPDFIVKTRAGAVVSDRLPTRKDAEDFIKRWIATRKNAVEARSQARQPKVKLVG